MGIADTQIDRIIELELNLGCGSSSIGTSIGFDVVRTPAVSVIGDLEQSLPFRSASFSTIYAYQVLEHLDNFTGLLGEAHRILTPGGKLIVEVPYFRSSWSHVDPTHRRHFTFMTFYYFCKTHYLNSEDNFHAHRSIAFSQIRISVITGSSLTGFKKLLARVALRFPEFYENSALSSLFIFHALHIELIK